MRAARNFGLLLSGEMLGQLVVFLITAHLARALGPEGFGLWTFTMAVILYLTILVDGGTETWGMRRVSTRPARLRRGVAEVVGLRLLLAAAVVTLLLLLGLGGVLAPERRLALLLGAVPLLAYALNLAWALRAIEVAVPVAAATLLQRLAALGLLLAFVRGPGDAPYVMLWQGLAELAGAAVCALALLRHGLPPLRAFRLRRLGRALREAWPMAITRALRGIMFTAGIGVLAFSWPDAEVGLYGAAQRIAMTMVVVSSIYGMAVFPAIARACAGRDAAQPEILAASFRLLAAMLVPACIGIAVLAGPITALVVGPGYDGAVLPLRLLMAAMLVAGLSDNLRRVLIGRGRQVLELRLMGLAVLAGLLLSGVLAWHAGAVGAALATLAAELILLLLLAGGVRRTGPAPGLLRALAFPAVAGAVMAAGVIALDGLPLALAVALGAAIYLGLLLPRRGRILADLRRLDAGPAQPGALERGR